MFEEFKIIKAPRKQKGTANKKKILLSIEREMLRDLSRIKPRSVTRQEAIRQIVEWYVHQKSLARIKDVYE